MDKLGKRFSNTSWRTKILISFFCLDIVLILSICTIYYNNAKKLLLYELQETNKVIIKLMGNEIKDTLDKVESVLYRLSFNNTIINIMSDDVDIDDYETQRKHQALISELIRSYANIREIKMLKVYFNKPYYYTKNSYRFFTFEDAKKADWYEDVLRNRGEICVTDPYKNMKGVYPDEIICSMARTLDSKGSQGMELLGFLEAEVDFAMLFRKTMIELRDIMDCQVYLVNDRGIINSTLNLDFIGKSIYEVIDLHGLDIDKSESLLSSDKLVTAGTLIDTNWKIITVVSLNNFHLKIMRVMMNIILTFLIISLAAFILNLMASFFINRKLKNLLSEIRKYFEKDDHIYKTNSDELMIITHSFQELAAQNQFLAHEVYIEQMRKKEIQMSLLQAQVNPHFLYNMLDTINWMAIKQNVPVISNAVQKLGRFYRTTLSRGKDIVSIKSELDLIRIYIDLQRIRFGDMIDLDIQVSEEICNCCICKMLLQPIVENSIIHGILEKDDPRGIIEIKGEIEREDIVLTITDDGVGVDRQKAKMMNSGQLEYDNRRGYGFQNVNERIKLFFGEKYQAIIIPREEGMEVRVTLPMQKLIIEEKGRQEDI